jgi:hypothetical protein
MISFLGLKTWLCTKWSGTNLYMHDFLWQKYIDMVITCKNHKNEVVNLLEGLGSLDDKKSY